MISPSRKHERLTAEREEEFANYRNLVEQRFTQMLEEEKSKMRRQFADKKDLLEKKLQFENEERMKLLTDNMKSEFNHNQRIADNRHYTDIMAKEKDLQCKLDEMQRRMEQEAIAREQAIEEKVQNRLKQQNERFEA